MCKSRTGRVGIRRLPELLYSPIMVRASRIICDLVNLRGDY